MTEEWRDVVGYEGLYRVSDQGRVKSFHRKSTDGRLLIPHKHRSSKNSKGSRVGYYLDVNLWGPDRLRKTRTIHRLVAQAFCGLNDSEYVDHINGDTSDNRSVNLRPCSPIQNSRHRTKSPTNTSGYKGVTWHKQRRKWQAAIGMNKKCRYLGLFDTPETAHEAYRAAALKYFGEFANFEIGTR